MLKLALAAAAATVVGMTAMSTTPALAQYVYGDSSTGYYFVPGMTNGPDTGLACVDFNLCDEHNGYLNMWGGAYPDPSLYSNRWNFGLGSADAVVYRPLVVEDPTYAIDPGDRYFNRWGGDPMPGPAVVQGAPIVVAGPAIIGPDEALEDETLDEDTVNSEAVTPRGYVNRAVPIEGNSLNRALTIDEDKAARCDARYQSYDADTNTFLGFDGKLHECRL